MKQYIAVLRVYIELYQHQILAYTDLSVTTESKTEEISLSNYCREMLDGLFLS